MRSLVPALAMALLALALIAAAPARAQDSGPPEVGQIIENTVFEHVVEEEVTKVSARALGQVTLDGAPLVEQPAEGKTAPAFAVGESSARGRA